MKKWIFSIALSIMALSALQAQPRPERGGGERVKALRTAFITNKLNLTPEEAQQFWPVYNQFEADQKKIRDQFAPGKDLMAMSDAEAEKFLNNQLDMEQNLLNLRKDYLQRMKKVLPVRKVAMLPRLEREFREELLGNLQQMRANRGGAAPQRPVPRN
jgi:hypothetical protein